MYAPVFGQALYVYNVAECIFIAQANIFPPIPFDFWTDCAGKCSSMAEKFLFLDWKHKFLDWKHKFLGWKHKFLGWKHKKQRGLEKKNTARIHNSIVCHL